MNEFKLKAPYKPTGDQPQAIEKLVEGFKEGNQFETLLGVTGSGKTFTMANVIAQLNKPTLVLAHNKTLAAQLYGEMKELILLSPPTTTPSRRLTFLPQTLTSLRTHPLTMRSISSVSPPQQPYVSARM